MKKQIKIVLFCLLTWGVILGLPVVLFFVLKVWLGESNSWLAWAIGVAVLLIGIVLGEWWSRLVNRLVYGSIKNKK